MELLALAKAQFYLHPAVLEIKRQGYEGDAVLHDAGVELQNLTLVHKKPAGSDRVLIEDITLLVWGYVHGAEEKLPILDCAECILKIDITGTDGFDLGARQLNAGLKALKHKILVEGLAVDRYFFSAQLLWQASHILS